MEPDVESTRLSLSPRAPVVRVDPARDLAADLDDTLPVGTTTRRRLLSDEPDPSVIRPVPDGALLPPRLIRPDAAARIRIGERVVALDRPVLVGRAPRRPRIPGAIDPQLLGVPSPTREVSATHLELRQSGTTVVVRDLRATNGSLVTTPGRAPQTLAQGESLVVGTGTTIDLGDGVVIEVIGVPSAAHADQGETA